jgi:hypothetical protein
MAREKKSEGEEVRIAFDGPTVEHDDLISNIEARNREDGERASYAGESRAAIKEFLDETNMNAKAFSWCRVILKQKDRAKAMDMIRSLEVGLAMVKAHVSGQQGDLFPEADDPIEPEPLNPVPDAVPDELRKPTYEADDTFAEEQDAFDRQLAEVAAE